MVNKTLRRNVVPSTAVSLAATLTSQVEQNTWGRGIRFYVTVSAVTATGTNDSLYLCAQIPGTATVIPLTGFVAANMLSVVGTYVFDFYPGAWLPPAGIAASGFLVGTAGIHLPLKWAVRVVFGTGNGATVVVDAETLP
jgi:hypothetical protein